jgi:hypothetical protein
MQWGTDLVSGNRVIFWSWFSGGFRFIRNNGGNRRRRGHSKRREKAQSTMAVRRKWLRKMPGVSL